MHPGMMKCRIPSLGHLDLLSSFVEFASSLVHISYILWARNTKFGVWMHLVVVECCVSLSGLCDIDLWPSF